MAVKMAAPLFVFTLGVVLARASAASITTSDNNIVISVPQGRNVFVQWINPDGTPAGSREQIVTSTDLATLAARLAANEALLNQTIALFQSQLALNVSALTRNIAETTTTLSSAVSELSTNFSSSVTQLNRTLSGSVSELSVTLSSAVTQLNSTLSGSVSRLSSNMTQMNRTLATSVSDLSSSFSSTVTQLNRSLSSIAGQTEASNQCQQQGLLLSDAGAATCHFARRPACSSTISLGVGASSNCGSTVDGASCVAVCNQGYTGVSATYSCVYNISANTPPTWVPTGPAITCTANPCVTLVVPANGAASGGTTTASVVNYTCNPGYTRVGAASTTCLPTGQWSAVAPSCDANPCPAFPTAPLNGTMSPSSGVGTTGTSVTFSCNLGFNMVGTSVSSCTTAGTWTSVAPSCTAVPCGSLSNPTSGAVTLASVQGFFTDIRTYTCTTGYFVPNTANDATATSVCQANGTWSRVVTACLARSCPTPMIIFSNGVRIPADGSGTTGTTVTYICNTGYSLVGTAISTCTTASTWSTVAPSCDPVPCGSLSNPTSGTVSNAGVNGFFSDVRTYTCNPGYFAQGSANENIVTSMCQPNRQWSRVVTTCLARSCTSFPSAPTNGAMTPADGSGTTGTTVTFQCNNGYTLTGTAISTCTTASTWSTVAPSCPAVSCGSLSNPPNGVVTNAGVVGTFTDSRTYTCSTGFFIQGTVGGKSVTTTCQASGTWSAAAPTCVGGIAVQTSRYGVNCNGVGLDVRSFVATACNGRASCTYNIQFTNFGNDPFPGCAKNFVVTYTCCGTAAVNTASIPGEAHGSSISFSCSC